MILVPAGFTETRHITGNMRSLGTTGQAFPTSRKYCKRKKLLLYHFFTTLFDFSVLPAKLDDGLLIQITLDEAMSITNVAQITENHVKLLSLSMSSVKRA